MGLSLWQPDPSLKLTTGYIMIKERSGLREESVPAREVGSQQKLSATRAPETLSQLLQGSGTGKAASQDAAFDFASILGARFGQLGRPSFGVPQVPLSHASWRYPCFHPEQQRAKDKSMALRGFVTGSDACTTSDGPGPSNAVASLANTLLGRSNKAQEQLHEVRWWQSACCAAAAPT